MNIVTQGISWQTGGLIALAAALCLLVLNFLKVRHPGRLTASVMLWRDAAGNPVRRVLREKLAHLLSLLLLLVTAAALTAALTEPCLTGGKNIPKLVIAAEPDGLEAAGKLLKDADPLRTALVLVSGGGVILRNFGESDLPLIPPEKTAVPDPDQVSALAEQLAGPDGMVCWIGSAAPPWLPEKGSFIRTGGKPQIHSISEIKVFLEHAPEKFTRLCRLIPGVNPVSSPEGADLFFTCRCSDEAGAGELEAETERFYEFLMRSGLCRSGGRQEITGIRNPDLPPSASVRLTAWCFLFALAAMLLDLVLWNRRKTV